MRVTITAPTVPGSPAPSPVELAGHGADSVRNFLFNGQRLSDSAGGVRKDYVDHFDRKNKRVEITFDSTRLFDTTGEAEDFVLTHFETVPAKGLLRIETSGGVIRFIDGALVQTVSTGYNGLTARVSYRITGGKILSAAPTP